MIAQGFAFQVADKLARTRTGAAGWRPTLRAMILAMLGVSVGFALCSLSREVERRQRLRACLLREACGLDGGPCCLRAQLRHPSGIDTDQLAAWIANGKALRFLDVREPEESEL